MITPIPAEELVLKTAHRSWLRNTGTLEGATELRPQEMVVRLGLLELSRTPEEENLLLG